ncbi:G-type lectin S-receptor-like serine/threonine-protein kinase At2g19130 [Cryptomeria japonica]|uniref:G-type lectin S-receptor-like serine/threonine-protein kinase At2g19130 n=1 Tax=Cryptomeria japonica TaxID=3369 RepID=UPI0027D9D543|nr:G-type lectin S-receptor-like serine/threonine-protein kinase At2g19130 [Cryptomeria japonica]
MALTLQKFLIIILSEILVAVLVALIFAFLFWQRRRLRPTQRCAASSDALRPQRWAQRFTHNQVKTATSNFRHKLGSGGFGTVFKGTLPDGTLVAVKKLESSKQCEKQFRAEINSVGIINHANLVRLRGFCAQGSRRLLVYDYMPNGSLNSFLFTNNSKHQSKILDWRTRFEIALGTARGLLYLHEQCSDRIIHGDIKPENILLDKDFIPKLGDFGLAKLVGRDFSKVVTATRGTRGYLAPEWLSGLPITPKVDVYSFGMTLLEIISGRRNLDLNVQESSRYYFPAWVKEQICERNMINIVDKRIASDADVEEVRRSALVSLLCIQNDEKARPNMAQVVLMLQGKTEPHASQIPSVTNQRVEDRRNTDGDGDYSDTDCIV